MRKLVLVAVLSAMTIVWGVGEASARHGGCGGCGGGGHCGGHHHHGCGGCGESCGGCGGGYSGCGGCGSSYGGCGSCGGGYCDAGCAGGYCYVDGGAGYTAIAAAPADTQAATLVVSLPAEAKLTVDDYATASTSGERTFTTPALKVGQEYHYTLTAVLNGQTVTKEVTVRGGETTRVNLDLPVSVAAR